ncbi:hypothetical protein OROGR_020005 [Orobanche gracilis]
MVLTEMPVKKARGEESTEIETNKLAAADDEVDDSDPDSACSICGCHCGCGSVSRACFQHYDELEHTLMLLEDNDDPKDKKLYEYHKARFDDLNFFYL